jgi:hypothetical protein
MKKLVNKTQCGFITKMCVLVACFFVVGCTQIDTGPTLYEGEIIEIAHGTTARFGELKIGLGNISKSDYTNDVGEKKHGLVATLWLLIKGNPPQKKQFDVYPGQNVKIDKYSVYVQQIRKQFLKGSIMLRVSDHTIVP